MCICSTIWSTPCSESQDFSAPRPPEGPACSTYLGELLCRHPTGCWGRGTPWLPPLGSLAHTVHAGSANLYCKNKNTWGQKFPIFSCGIFYLWRRIKHTKKQISQDHTQKGTAATKKNLPSAGTGGGDGSPSGIPLDTVLLELLSFCVQIIYCTLVCQPETNKDQFAKNNTDS